MVESVAHVRFTWNPGSTSCRASAYDGKGNLLGELVLDVPEPIWDGMRKARGHGVRLRIEESLDRNLRAMLEFRY